jgi:hypothetical protein
MWGRPSVFRFWLLGRSPAGNAADRSGQLFSDIETAFPEGIESLRGGLAGQARELFQLGLFHALPRCGNWMGIIPDPVRSGQASFNMPTLGHHGLTNANRAKPRISGHKISQPIERPWRASIRAHGQSWTFCDPSSENASTRLWVLAHSNADGEATSSAAAPADWVRRLLKLRDPNLVSRTTIASDVKLSTHQKSARRKTRQRAQNPPLAFR